jgi:hypothetical protein
LLRAAASLSDGIEASGGALASKEQYCSTEHRLAFTITAQVAPSTGTEVELIDGSPPRLIGDDGEIGVIDTRQEAIRNCLLDDWDISGTIAVVNAASGKGVAVVKGHH